MRLRIAALLVILLGSTGAAFADQVVDGRIGPGALYRIVVPDTNWNGTLLLYAHGFVPASDPVALPPDAELFVRPLVKLGFAVAYSSFSENGWAVKDGAQRTQQLLGIFTSKFGSPSRVYIGGGSMGGLVAIKLVEEHPSWFDGMLAACPVSGGGRAQADYQANVRALFDVFYSGVLPGDAGGVPGNVDPVTQIAAPAAAAMTAEPLKALAIASVTQTPVPFANPTELGQSIVTALLGHAAAGPDLLPQLHGKPYFDNRSVLYTGTLPQLQLDFINATVGRFDAAPSALNYLDHYYQPTGRLTIPTLTISNSRDPVAPGFHRAMYGSLVAAAGASNLLVQRTVDRYGHCNLLSAEVGAAFADLVKWVEFGIKPAP